MNPIEYSIVIPVKNEEGNLRELIEEIEAVMVSLQKPWELLCIDDGSTDGSLQLLKQLAASKKYLKTISFTQNFGQSSAFDAGFKFAKGKFIITLDGDRQNDPKDIPKLINAMDEDNSKGGSVDLVCGWRKERRDPKSKRLISRLSNWVRSRLCQDDMHDTGCSLKVYRADSLKKIKMYQGMHRFLPALFKIEGFIVKEIPVNHRERVRGVTKYHFFNRSVGPIVDMLAVSWMRKRQLRYKIHSQITNETSSNDHH